MVADFTRDSDVESDSQILGRDVNDKRVTPFQILGVDIDADKDTIKSAYRNILKSGLHPDLGGKSDDAARINLAYAILARDEKYASGLKKVLIWTKIHKQEHPVLLPSTHVIPPSQQGEDVHAARPLNMAGNHGGFNDHDNMPRKSRINKALVALCALAGAALLYMYLAPKNDTAPVNGADEAASKTDTNINKGKDTKLPDDIKAELVRIANTVDGLQPTITSPDQSKPTVKLSYDYTPYSDRIVSMEATVRPYDYSPQEGNFISSKVTIAFKDASGKLKTDTVAMCISEPDTQDAIRANEKMQAAVNALPASNLGLKNCNDGSRTKGLGR